MCGKSVMYVTMSYSLFQAIHTLGSREDIESLSVSDKMAAMSTADGVQGVAGESQTTSTVATGINMCMEMYIYMYVHRTRTKAYSRSPEPRK